MNIVMGAYQLIIVASRSVLNIFSKEGSVSVFDSNRGSVANLIKLEGSVRVPYRQRKERFGTFLWQFQIYAGREG